MSRAVQCQQLPRTNLVAPAFLEALRQALHMPQVSSEQVAMLLLLLLPFKLMVSKHHSPAATRPPRASLTSLGANNHDGDRGDFGGCT